MRSTALLFTATALLSACSAAERDRVDNASSGNIAAGGEAADSAAEAGGPQWDLQSSGEGVALALSGGDETVVRLFCPAGQHRLLVNVPAFRPVGSEERMSFGSGGEVVALVADSRGDRERGGVSATGPVPDNLAALIAGQVAVNYGAQNSGPHAAPPAQSARAFAAACSEAPPAEPGPPPSTARPPAGRPLATACRMQAGETIPPNLLKAIGTEPFWGARIEGRCVTYSHPENQPGTRIWTTFTGSRENGVWTGFYQNERFVLRTRPEAGCSDGMSDNRYPIAVSLTVGGEERTGCAQPL